ncbi:MAG TPA: EAL domain-containing protein [Aquihabitans sp.]|jgi:diguanylate cyclase (GGDEF)-like protein/PAS domain S-box-containing protein|nr:EAL domain-containing protein [Aquihabitans sp.]
MDAPVKQRGWLIYLIVGLAASFVAGLTGSASIIGIVTQVAGWSSVAIGLSVARRSQKDSSRPWVLFALAASAFLVAGVVRSAHGVVVGVDRPFPSPADVIALSGHVLLIIGGTLLGHLRSPDRDRAAIIDGAIIAGALQTMVWAWLLWPYMNDGSIRLAERSINGVYAAMTMVVLATIGRLAVGPGARTLSYRLLAGAVITIFLQDVLVTVDTVGGPDASLGRALAPPIFVLFGAAALHPARMRIAEAPARLEVRLTWRRVSVLIASLLINPVIIGVQLLLGQDPTLVVAVISTVLLTLLVLARFALLARAQERAVEVQRIQREANGELAAASSRHAMHRAGLRAAMRLADDPDARVALAQVVDRSLRVIDATGAEAEAAVGTSIAMEHLPRAVVDGLTTLEPSVVDATTPIDLGPSSGAASRSVSLLVAPLSSQNELSGAMVVTTRRPIPATLRQSIETLASTVSLALESATLTENLLRRRSERRFRALVENSSDIVLVVNDERQITFASPAAHRLLGIREKALMGSHPARWVHPDDWPALAAVLDGGGATEDTEIGELEVRFRHVDGSHRWFEIRTKDLHHDPEIEGLVVTAREITDRKATEQQLAASEARFRALVQNSTDVVAVIDERGEYSYVSPAVSEMLGYLPEELEGTRGVALLAPGELGNFRDAAPELSQPQLPEEELQVRRFEAQVRHRNGELRTLDVGVTDMRHEPAVNGIVLNARDITVRKALERDLRYQAMHDTLTGLANRTMFTQQTATALRVAASDATSVGALFIDLDDFKTVNDSLGHAVGDELLQEVAKRLIATLSPADLAARLGGDEFAVLVVDGEGERGVLEVADQVIDIVAQPFTIQGREIRVTCSIGIALATEEADAEVLLRSADVAMYLAKDRGKNRAAMFEDHLHTSVFERLELKADLVRAIEDGQLRCHYQPIVSLQTGRITGVEALVRWDHPVRGRLTPDAFIPLAEDTGLIVPLGGWVLRESCRQLRQWQLRLPRTSSLTISVNLSVRQLAHEHIIRDVREAIEDAQLDPSTLTLEITETTLMHDTEVTRHRLAQLRELGVSLAVDDFGTGYSSLQYVQRFPIDIIKIDRSFVTGLGTNPGDGAVVQSMIELSQRLGVHTVAEGIDRPEQIAILQSLGADLGQGYLFSKPVPAEQIDALLASSPLENPKFLLH